MGVKFGQPTFAERLEVCFRILQAAAINNEPCPPNNGVTVRQEYISALREQGDISVRYLGNFRHVTLHKGDFAGLQTAEPEEQSTRPENINGERLQQAG